MPRRAPAREKNHPWMPNESISFAARGDDSVAALAALYRAEKADASNVSTIAMAMMGIGIAYVVGSLSFLSSLSH
jgi:hypothetical protein